MAKAIEYRTFETDANDDGPDFSYDILYAPRATHVHSDRIRNNPYFSARDYLIPKYLVDGSKDMAGWDCLAGKTKFDIFEQLRAYREATFSILKGINIDRSHLWTPHGGRFEQQYGLFDDLEDQGVSLAKRMNYQGKSAIIGNYGEEVTADILNGTIIDTNGKYPDISLQDDNKTVFVECKSGRLHSGVTTTANKHSQFVIKRNQLVYLLEMERALGCHTFYSLIVYDIVGGGDMSLAELCEKHQELFHTTDLSQYIQSNRKRIRDILFVPRIYIIPTRALAFWWNSQIDRIWPLSTFSAAKKYRDDSMPVYIKCDNKQLEEIKNLLHQSGIEEYRYQAHFPVHHSHEGCHNAHADAFYALHKSPIVDAYGLKFAPHTEADNRIDIHIQTIC